MLKAYAVALAMTTTSPVATTNDVELKTQDTHAPKVQVEKGYKRRGLVILPAETNQVKKGYKRRGLVILP